MQLPSGKWVQETAHGRSFFWIESDGIHVRSVTDNGGRTIEHKENVISFEDTKAKAEGQLLMPV